jgi:hypothetical protein
VSESWRWLALAGLGAFHGVNPAMGWLFAVALGLYRQRRSVVLQSLLPIAVGHALAVAVVALAVLALDALIDERGIRVAAATLLLGWAAYHRLYGSRHRVRIGMTTGMVGLGVWSFLMASAHGAGLMLVPVLLPLGRGAPHAGHGDGLLAASDSLGVMVTAVAVHTGAMLTVTGLVAVAIYEWVGLAVLRRGWINLDRLWEVALAASGLLMLVTTSW